VQAAPSRGCEEAFAAGDELAPVRGYFGEDGASERVLRRCEAEGEAGSDAGFDVGEPAGA
jgi:hypothetical protein